MFYYSIEKHMKKFTQTSQKFTYLVLHQAQRYSCNPEWKCMG